MNREFPRGPCRHWRQGFINIDVQNIGRQFKEYGTGPSFYGLPEGNGQIFRYPFNVVTCGCPFGNGFHNVHLVHFLKRSFEIIPQRVPAANHHHRGIVQECIGNTGNPVGKSRPRSQETYTRLACVHGPGMGHHCRRLLMPDIDGANFIFRETVQNRFQMSAGNAENHIHLFDFF